MFIKVFLGFQIAHSSHSDVQFTLLQLAIGLTTRCNLLYHMVPQEIARYICNLSLQNA